MILLMAACINGAEVSEEFPNHQAEEVICMACETEQDLFVEILIEDAQGNTLHYYKRTQHNVY